MAIPVATALTSGVHVKTYDYSALGGGLPITLAGSATNTPILNWEWSILATDPDLEGGIPESSSVATGTNGDFTNGKATVQNPTITLDVAGGYCFSLRAQNAEGWSDPDADKNGGYQAIVYIKTPWGVKQPPANQKRYQDDLNQGLQTLEDLAEVVLANTSSILFAAPPAGTGATSVAGDYAVGSQFSVLKSGASIVGAHFDTQTSGSHTIRVRLWEKGNATPLKSVDVAAAGPGIYQATFSSPYVVSAAEVPEKLFYISMYETGGSQYTRSSDATFFGQDSPLFMESYIVWGRPRSWGSGGALPSSLSVTESYCIDPIIEWTET